MAKSYKIKFKDNGRTAHIVFTPDPFCCNEGGGITEPELGDLVPPIIEQNLCPNFIQVPAGTGQVIINSVDWVAKDCFPTIQVYMDILNSGIPEVVVGPQITLEGITAPGAGNPSFVRILFGAPTTNDDTYIVFK